MRSWAALAVVVSVAASARAAAPVKTRVALLLRDKPAQSARTVERLPAGRRVTVIARSGEWVHVSVGKHDGWLPAAQLSGLERAPRESGAPDEETPLAGKRAVRPEAWVEQSRYHDGIGPTKVQVVQRTDLIARPADGAQVVGMAKRGETLGVVRTSRDGRWYLIELGGGEVGWIASSAVRPVGGAPAEAGVPVAAPPDATPAPQIVRSTPPPAPVEARQEPPPPAPPPPPTVVAEAPPPPPPPATSKKRHRRGERVAVAETATAPAPVESAPNKGSVAPADPTDGSVEQSMEPPSRGGLWATARAGLGFLGQRFTSNGSGFLANYETDAGGLAVDLELGYRHALGRRFHVGVDGGYRFAGATGFEVSAPSGKITLGLQVHDVDAGLTFGVRFAFLGGFTASLHAGGRMVLDIVELSSKAALPSDRVIALGVGVRLEAPVLWRDLGARIDAQLIAPGSIAQTGGLGEGQSDGVLGFSAGAELSWRLPRGFSVDGGWRFTTISTHLSGKAERSASFTSADRSVSTQLVSLGVSYTR